MRVLVGILHHGENEYARCVASVEGHVQFVIDGLPNKDAHDVLYERFNQERAHFDLFLKLDADMIVRPGGMDGLIAALGDSPHLAMDVWDWPSLSHIPAVHMWRSSKVEFADTGDLLNVDRRNVTLTGGESKVVTRTACVDHMIDPSPWQCFRYGLHRAFKARQDDRERGVIHAVVLASIARHWRATQDDRLALVIAGAQMVFQGQAEELADDYAGPRARAVFERVNESRKWVPALQKAWPDELRFYLCWVKGL